MTLREQIITAKGGGCETCTETRAPALMVLVDHERSSSWERYWAEVYDIVEETPDRVRIRCRNCAACEQLAKRRTGVATPSEPQATPKNFYVVRLGPNNEPPPWLASTDFAITIKNDGTYEVYPQATPWEGEQFGVESAPFSYTQIHRR